MTKPPGTEPPGTGQPAEHASRSILRRVAFFGGSFDPPHLGHLAVARAAFDALQLDAVLFAPVGAQPLKPQGSTAPFTDRLAMTRLAVAGEPGFEISLADAPNAAGEPNYTLETLRGLGAALPPGGLLFCLMGADSFVSLRRWRGAAEIPFAASLIVASRPGERLDDLARHIPQGLRLEPSTTNAPGEPSSAAAEDEYAKNVLVERGALPNKPRPISTPAQIDLRSYVVRNAAGEVAPFYMLPDLDVEISASEIRNQIRNQVRSSDHNPPAAQSLLPGAVADYIRDHRLYR
jgi:nicotinate-nucleotide adenylyltransferase